MSLKDKKSKKYLENIYQLSLEYGFNEFTMEEIAERIGITKMTLYNNFKDKETLKRYILSYRSEKYADYLNSLEDSRMNAIEELFSILDFQEKYPLPEIPVFYVSFLKANPRVFGLYKAKLRRILKKFIVNNIKKGMSEGIYLEGIDSDSIAVFMINTMENMMEKWLNNNIHLNLKKVHEDIICYHVRGIANAKGLKILENHITEK